MLVHKTARNTSELNKRKLATVDEIINERRGSFCERVQEQNCVITIEKRGKTADALKELSFLTDGGGDKFKFESHENTHHGREKQEIQ